MRITYVTYARMPTEKAHGLQIASMCQAFMEEGHTVELITPEAEQNPIREDVSTYYRLREKFAHRTLGIWNVVGLRTHPTPLHHYCNEFFFAIRCFFVKIPNGSLVYTRSASLVRIFSLRGFRVIAEQHFWPEKASGVHTWFLRPAVVIPCNSEGTKEACVRHGLGQAMVAPNAIDATLFENVATKEEARKALGLSLTDRIVMYIGSLEKWKGVETLCKAAAYMREGTKVVIIGGKKEDVAQLSARYPQVIFLGQRPYYELPNHQQAADVLVVPNDPVTTESAHYTSPIKLFAHMASGIPTLVSDLPSMRVIGSEDMLWFFKAGDPEALAKAVENISVQTGEAATRAQRAREKIMTHTWRARAQTILAKSKIL